MSGTTSHWGLPYDLLADTADIEAVGKALADRLETVLNARFGTDPTSGSSVRTALGLAIGSDVQAHDADLDAIAALSTTSIGRSLLAAVDAAALRTIIGAVIGTDVQAHDADLDAIAGLSSAADKAPYFTGAGAAALMTVTAFIRTLLDDPDAATARGTLGAAPTASPTLTGTATLPSIVTTSTTLGFFGATPVGRQGYGVLSYVTSRDLNSGTVTLQQLANVVGTLIDDLCRLGLIGPHT